MQTALRIESGRPTAEELAAVVAVVSQQHDREIAEAVVADEPVDRWSRVRRMRRLPEHGAWNRAF
ncbi:acyl-CoA carboxylase epsilon subunit [Microbacterium sp. gxy059]|uniref:acyl-CoA carboxylase epsilon subunit n=1 Tax=Microbacterium sp. gxy059 TaxID=2957199 RepID=UPI003D98E421